MTEENDYSRIYNLAGWDLSELREAYPPQSKKRPGSGRRKPFTRERKFNIRIRQNDIVMLDGLSKHQHISRSALLNKILYEIMRDELMRWQDDDARGLLAYEADKNASYDELATPWVNDALSTKFGEIVDSMDLKNSSENTDHSKDFLRLHHKLAETDKQPKTAGRSRKGNLRTPQIGDHQK